MSMHSETSTTVASTAPSPVVNFVYDGAEYWREAITERDVFALRDALASVGSDIDAAGVYRKRLRAKGGKTFVSFARSGRNGEPQLMLLPVEAAAPRLAYEGSFDSGQTFTLESEREYRTLLKANNDASKREMEERAVKQARLDVWFKRSRIARAFLQVAAKRPEQADLLIAIARAIDVEPEKPTLDEYYRIKNEVPSAALDIAAK